MMGGMLAYQHEIWEFVVDKQFSIAYHTNFHLLLPSSLTLMRVRLIENEKEMDFILSKMNFKHFIFANIMHIPAV